MMKRIIKNKRAEEKSFKDYIIIFILASLFIVCVYKFALGTGDNYGTDLSVDDKQLDLTALESGLENTSISAKGWETAFTDDEVDVTFTTLILFSIWGIGKLMIGTFNTFATIFLKASYNVLGIDPMVTGTIVAILIILVIFALWKTIKTGQ